MTHRCAGSFVALLAPLCLFAPFGCLFTSAAGATTTTRQATIHGYDGSTLSLDRMAEGGSFGALLSTRPAIQSLAAVAGPGFLAAESAGARFVVGSAGETRIFVRAGDDTLEVSQHAARRITQRGLTIDKVEGVVDDSQPFRYFRNGTWRTGYVRPAVARLRRLSERHDYDSHQ